MTIQQPAKILVIDDEVIQRMLVKEYLEEAGFLVRLSEDGRHGLKMASTTNPDLIIVDALLPSIDGYAICTILRQDPRTAEIPILLITASKEPDAITRGLAAGATDFITKPVEWRFLADRVTHVLEKSRTMRELQAANRRMEQQLRTTQTKSEQEEACAPRDNTGATTFEDQIKPFRDDAAEQVRKANAAAVVRIRAAKAMTEEKIRVIQAEADERVRHAKATASAMLEAMSRSHADKTAALKEAAAAELNAATTALARSTRSFWSFFSALGGEQLRLVESVLEKLAFTAASIDPAPRAAEPVETLRRAGQDAKNLAELINNARLMAQHMTGEVPLRETQFNLKTFMDSILQAVAPSCRARRVSVKSGLTDAALNIQGDEARIKYSLLHLLANAIAFSLSGATILLDAERTADGGVRITIKDNGIGIPPAVLDKLRTVLQEPAHMITQKDGGVGFGVPIASAIASLHGGRLEFASALGEGTTVSLVLPPERVRDSASGHRRIA
jgi:signal transduction histidine kinase